MAQDRNMANKQTFEAEVMQVNSYQFPSTANNSASVSDVETTAQTVIELDNQTLGEDQEISEDQDISEVSSFSSNVSENVQSQDLHHGCVVRGSAHKPVRTSILAMALVPTNILAVTSGAASHETNDAESMEDFYGHIIQNRRKHTLNYIRSPQLRSQYTYKTLPESFLHMLPGELRNDIYNEVGFAKPRQNLHMLNEPKLCQAFPSLKSEVCSKLFKDATFDVDTYTKFSLYGEDTTTTRQNVRGVRWGTGKLVIPKDGWIMKAEHNAVKFGHICIRVREIGGMGICNIFLNNTIGGKQPGPRATVPTLKSQLVRKRLKRAKDAVLRYVRDLREDKDFYGFTLSHLQDIASIVEDPDHLTFGAKTHAQKERLKAVLQADMMKTERANTILSRS